MSPPASRLVRLLGVALAAALLVAAGGPARAETGALTPEVSAGGSLGLLATPYADPGLGVTSSTAPAGAVGLRYALSDDLEVGLRLGACAPVTVDHLFATGGTDRLLEHGYQAGFAEALVRRYLAGLDWRLFVEGGLGWDHRRYFSIQQYQVVAGGASTLGGPLPPFAADDLFAGVGPGLEYVWDHAAVGVRGEVDARVGPSVSGSPPHPPAVTWGFGASVYLAWSFYP